ncbi:hypothetical protein E1292_38000 [Nonomuraea deserti]|uniref:Uncharacterized protein n=1 Tax=Nonomuraea deserti TaxID=1848322 RepID=A0A4R4VAX1_9ACTN|nr:hypothetical protein [Nonomuraea deserti]TDC96639.1 hypothetical protein E1292_38000 [Nonomuraea deserti]
MAVVRDLGTPVKRHETDIRRRKRIFLVAVPLGVLAACLGILMVAALGGPAVTGGATVIPGVVLGMGLGAFGAGLWQGLLSVTRPDEAFTLYEGGLAHSYAGRCRAISWDEIAKVIDHSRDNLLNRALGGDVHYRVKLRCAVGGRRVLVITGLTEDAAWLGEMVEQAVWDRDHPRACNRRPAVTAPGLAVSGAGGRSPARQDALVVGAAAPDGSLGNDVREPGRVVGGVRGDVARAVHARPVRQHARLGHPQDSAGQHDGGHELRPSRLTGHRSFPQDSAHVQQGKEIRSAHPIASRYPQIGALSGILVPE